MRILIADDDADTRALVARSLRQEFAEPEILEAMDRASLDRGLDAPALALVVTDYDLRWATGLDVLRAARERHPDCAVVMFTGTGNEEVAVEAMKEGLDDYVVKRPTAMPRLMASLRRAVDRSQARRALRAAEDDLRASLEEKTLLLQELYHRLHNTLQVVQSLVAQAGRRFEEPPIRGAFDAVVDRIHSIAMLQEQFYRSGNLSSLAFAPYLEALAGNVLGGAADRVAVRLDLDPVQLPVGKAVPMALIANEFLMNAFKHAFPEGRRGTVSVTLKREGDRAVLTVSDDGVGRGEAREAKGSGLGIAGRLARQVGAEIAFPDSPQGTTAVAAFRPDA